MSRDEPGVKTFLALSLQVIHPRSSLKMQVGMGRAQLDAACTTFPIMTRKQPRAGQKFCFTSEDVLSKQKNLYFYVILLLLLFSTISPLG